MVALYFGGILMGILMALLLRGTMFRGEAHVLDTSLRVLDQPVWRLSTTGAFVCEAAKGEPVLLVYTPPVRRGNLDERG